MKTKLNLLSENIVKRLIDKGFDYEVDHVYNKNGDIVYLAKYTSEYGEENTPAPYIEIALQFLKNEYDIDIFLARIGNITMPNIGYAFIMFYPDEYEPKFLDKPFRTAEDALSAGIVNTLDYIDGINNFNRRHESNDIALDNSNEK